MKTACTRLIQPGNEIILCPLISYTDLLGMAYRKTIASFPPLAYCLGFSHKDVQGLTGGNSSRYISLRRSLKFNPSGTKFMHISIFGHQLVTNHCVNTQSCLLCLKSTSVHIHHWVQLGLEHNLNNGESGISTKKSAFLALNGSFDFTHDNLRLNCHRANDIPD